MATIDGMECGCACNVEWEPWEFFECCDVRARKRHKCCECGGQIEVGELYEYAKGRSDGIFQDYHTCIPCARIRVDHCCSYGGVAEELWECLGFNYVTGEWARWALDEDE